MSTINGYNNDDYVEGYLRGLEAGKSLNKAGEWVFLGVGIAIGLVAALLINIFS